MSNTHATRGRRVLTFLLGLLLAFSMLPAEALAFVRDEVVVLGEEESVGEAILEDDDNGDEPSDEPEAVAEDDDLSDPYTKIEAVEEDVEVSEQEEQPEQKKPTAYGLTGDFVYTVQSEQLDKAEVKVSKVDVGDHAKELEGATIKIINKATGDVEAEWTSKKDDETTADVNEGVHVVTGLKTGVDYVLHEEVAPHGYAIAADTEFSINADGTVNSKSTTFESGVLLVEDTLLKKPEFEKKIADINDSEGTLPKDITEITSDATEDPRWQDSADYDIGDHVPYRLDAQLPDDVDAYKGYHLTFTDQMEEGLTLDADSIKVMVGEGQGAHEVTDYDMEPEEHGFGLTVRWGEQAEGAKTDSLQPAQLNGKHVYVYFTATLNEGAKVGDEGNVNGAKLAFSNDANSDAEDDRHEHETDWDYVIAFTYKMEVSKRWANAYGEDVEPAKVEFKLEKVLADRSTVEVALDEDNCTKNDEGIITTFAFRGLDDGDYVLTETAPEGFKGAGEVRFTVTAGHVTEWDKTSAARDAEGASLEASFPEGEGRDDGLTLNGEATSGYVTFATPTDGDGNQYLATEVTNLEVGSLEVTKTVAGAPEGQRDKEFKVTIRDNTCDQLYWYVDGQGRAQSSAEERVLTVSNSKPIELTGIPTGNYVVAELDEGREIAGYKFIGVSGETGASDEEGLVLRGQTTTVALTNTYTIPEKGALLIHKRVAGGRVFIDEMDKLVRFTVTDAQGNVVASRLLGEFDERVMLPDGDSGIRVWTITGLDVGSYTVTESRDDADSDNPANIDYEAYGLETGSSASVTIEAEKVTEVRPSNVYNEAAGWTKLRAAKAVEGSELGDKDEVFTFDVRSEGIDLDDKTAEVKPEDVLPADPTIATIAGETGETANIYFSQTGRYYYSITERVPASPTPGMTYDASPRYARVDVRDDSKTYVAYGTDLAALQALTADQVVAASAAEETSKAIVTNTYGLGNLEVKKGLLGAPADAADQDFDVVVTSNESGRFVAADGTLTDEEQVLNVSKNTPLEIHDIPVGPYTVTELESNRGIDLYTFVGGESTTKGTAVVPLNGTAKVVLTNAYKKNTISAQFKVRNVVKVIKGSKYTGTENFKFVLRAVTKGAPMPAQTTATAKAGGTASFGKITFDTEGEYLYSITEAKGTTPGMTYDTKPHYALATVEEGEDNLVAEVTYGSTKDTADEDESLTITNTYGQTADLTIKKTVASTRAADKAKSYKFKVTLYKDKARKKVKKLTGTYGNLKFKNGVAKFTLRHGQSKTAKGLPVGTYYTAEETDSGGLVKSLSVKQTATGSVVTCTNTYKPTTPHRTTPGHTTRRTIKSATVSNIPDKVYSGKAIRPKPTIKLGKTKLTKNVDYTLEYYNNINVGTGVIVITGIGNYEDTKVCTFNIRKAPNALSVKAKKKSVKLSAVKKKAQVVAPLKVTGANGAVAYRKVANGSAPQLKVNKKTGKVTVKKGTKKGTYVIKIKVTASGNANHLSASRVVKVKVAVSGNATSKVVKSKIV